jgi:transposase
MPARRSAGSSLSSEGESGGVRAARAGSCRIYLLRSVHRADLFLAGAKQARRLAKDYERLPETAVAMIYAALSRLMLRRLARLA